MTWKVYEFYRIRFDESWQLVSTTAQLFTYKSKKKDAVIEVCYQAPVGEVKTITLVCDVERGAIIHRNVLHVKALVKGIAKGDIIKAGT
jgi:hypothetical protein